MFNDSIFIKKISYELDELKLFEAIESLSYTEYINFRNDFLHFAVLNEMVKDTAEGKNLYWHRIIVSIKSKYNFVIPASTSKSAIQKRYQRMG